MRAISYICALACGAAAVYYRTHPKPLAALVVAALFFVLSAVVAPKPFVPRKRPKPPTVHHPRFSVLKGRK